MNHCLTVKITNTAALEKQLGKKELAYVVRRALTRIGRDVRLGGGVVGKITATRLLAEFPSSIVAERMAIGIDAAINDVPVAKGLRLENAVFVGQASKAEMWRATCIDDEFFPEPCARSSLGPAQRAVVRFGTHEAVLDASRPTLAIGRDQQHNGIVVMHPWVSRRHATIAWRDGHAEVVDLSANGTYLRFDGMITDIRVGATPVSIEANATLSFGMPFAVTNGKPVRAEIEMQF